MNKNKFEEIRKKILEYNLKRNWTNQDAGDLAKSIVLEAAELLEHFQWDQTSSKSLQEKDWAEIGSEVADVFWYIITFCHVTGMDLLDVTEKKIRHNEQKYPLDKNGLTLGNKYYKERKKLYRSKKSA